MKKILIVFFGILMLFGVFVNAAQNIDRPTKSDNLDVTMISQIPDSADPGKYVDVRFKFDNLGRETAENVEAEILPRYPFSLDPGTSAVKSLGSINAQQKGDKGVVIKYRLRVDKDALEGQNEIKLRYRTSYGVWVTLPEFEIYVQPYDTLLVLDKVVTKPEVIKSGERATISLTFKNMAEILLKKIRVKIDLGAAQLAPIGSTNEKVIQTIDKGKSAELVFDVIGEPDATAGIYSVPIQYLYYDNLGNSYFRNSTIGLIVGSEPDLSVNIDSTTIYQAKKLGDVTIKIVNKDVNEIKFLNVNLAESNDYKITSPNDVYVGNIDSDDYETAEFTLYVENKKGKEILLPLTLEYRDANNKVYRDNVKLKLPLYDASEAKKLGLVEGNGKTGLIVTILVIVVGLFMYRRWRKHRKKKL